jgi:hypothetical protein
MPRPHDFRSGLLLLACVLTLAASADDFCLPRLVLLGIPADTGSTPDDDPNSDFTRVTRSVSAQRLDPRADWPECPTDSGAGAAASCAARRGLLLEGARAGGLRPQPAALNSPLRC